MSDALAVAIEIVLLLAVLAVFALLVFKGYT